MIRKYLRVTMFAVLAVAVGADELSSAEAQPFAMVFGKCTWQPPSPKAAMAALSYFYGFVPSMMASDYEAAIAEQYVSAGRTEAQAADAVRQLEACFASYAVPPQKHFR